MIFETFDSSGPRGGSTQLPRAQGEGRRRLDAVITLALFYGMAAATALAAGHARHLRIIKVEGVVTRVEPSEILLQTSAGAALHLPTAQNVAQGLLPGAIVTAWYTRHGESRVLVRIEAPLNQFLTPPSAFMRRIHKAIVLPGGHTGDSTSLSDQVADYLHHQFHWFMPPVELAQEIRRVTVQNSVLDAMNADTGAFDMSKYAPSHTALIRKIASEAGVDAVFEVLVQQESVGVSAARGVADWDGTRQVIESAMVRAMAQISIVRSTMDIPAATIVVELWNAEGKVLWIGRRGLFLLVTQGGRNKLRVVPLSALLSNRALVDQRLEGLFSALGPAARSTDIPDDH